MNNEEKLMEYLHNQIRQIEKVLPSWIDFKEESTKNKKWKDLDEANSHISEITGELKILKEIFAFITDGYQIAPERSGDTQEELIADDQK